MYVIAICFKTYKNPQTTDLSHLKGDLLQAIIFSQSSFRGLFIQARQVISRLAHHLQCLIVINPMTAIEKVAKILASKARAAAKAFLSMQGI